MIFRISFDLADQIPCQFILDVHLEFLIKQLTDDKDFESKSIIENGMRKIDVPNMCSFSGAVFS